MSESASRLPQSEWPDTSHLVTSDDEPLDSTFQERQQKLLVDALHSSWSGRFLALGNVGLFHALHEPPIVPDVMVILDVDLLPCDRHRSYFVWEYGKPPDLVVEVVSKEPGGEDQSKLARYARIGVPYYVVYDPYGYLKSRPVRAFQHRGRGFVELLKATFLDEIGLGLAVWEGTYAGCTARFLRFTDRDGQLLLTGAERAEQERQRADQERHRADALALELEQLKRRLDG